MTRLITLILALCCFGAQAQSKDCPAQFDGPPGLHLGMTPVGGLWFNWYCHSDATDALTWTPRVRAFNLADRSAENMAAGLAIAARFFLKLSYEAQISAPVASNPVLDDALAVAQADMLARPIMYAWVTVDTPTKPCDCRGKVPKYAGTGSCPAVGSTAPLLACRRL